MERNSVAEHQKSSNEDEADRAGSGRSYECVFCKRGFTTAQALGGHMNIHRKDRAKSRPEFDDDYYAALRGYTAIQAYPPPLQFHCQSWGFRPPVGEGFYVQRPSRVEEDWPRSVGLQIGPSDHGRGEGSGAVEELDLELRLGHHHR